MDLCLMPENAKCVKSQRKKQRNYFKTLLTCISRLAGVLVITVNWLVCLPKVVFSWQVCTDVSTQCCINILCVPKLGLSRIKYWEIPVWNIKCVITRQWLKLQVPNFHTFYTSFLPSRASTAQEPSSYISDSFLLGVDCIGQVQTWVDGKGTRSGHTPGLLNFFTKSVCVYLSIYLCMFVHMHPGEQKFEVIK